MKEISVYGQSDDNVYMDSDDPRFGDQFNGWGKTCTLLFESQSTGERVVVTALYGFNGTWSIGLTLHEEDDSLPDWGFKFGQENYSPRIIFNTPDDVTVKCTSDD